MFEIILTDIFQLNECSSMRQGFKPAFVALVLYCSHLDTPGRDFKEKDFD